MTAFDRICQSSVIKDIQESGGPMVFSTGLLIGTGLKQRGSSIFPKGKPYE
jgi:hypothetical protein